MRRALSLFLLLHLAGSAMAQTAPAAAADVRVMGITLSGNRTTKARIILREMVVNEGDTLAHEGLYQRLERSRQNLMNTGLFNTVSVLPLYLDQRHVMVEVTVNERWYLWPAIIFDLADPNFNTWWLTRDLDRVNYGLYLYRYNLRGRNETGYIKAQFGYTREFAFRYKVPNLTRDQRWGISAGMSYEEQSEITTGTVDNLRNLVRYPFGSNRDQWNADVEVTLRRNHDIRHIARLRYTQAEVRDTIIHSAVDYFEGPATATRFLALGYSFVWDRRDSRAFPRRGHFQELRIDRLGLGIMDLSAPGITTMYATTKRWVHLHAKWTLGLSARGKYTFGMPPYFVQEGLGYGNFVRGYEYRIIDGEHFALGKANLILQLVKPRTYRVEHIPIEAFRTFYFALYLNLYSDLGRVWDSRYAALNPLSNRWINGNGLGLDLVTSYDQVLRAEYSVNSQGDHGFFLHFTQPF
ncbi:MAG: BamA/TamA family outer membrane protein [Flavobacteriales bacterium]|jgi:outer membrane protein assembly factor BamA|nr:BamA/TamA family outer membrane protein [Flavobacteriales bacterium]